jgi:RNA binding exosome subunit
MKRTIKLTEKDLTNIVKRVIEEQQGLYGNPSDVVDYELPEFLSDTIILKKIENFHDVKRSLKELHKRLLTVERSLGQHKMKNVDRF